VSGIDKPRVACLGLAFKADVDDFPESPAIKVVHLLLRDGYVVRAYDPYASRVPGLEEVGVASLGQAVVNADLPAVLTEHKQFASLDLQQLNSMRRPALFDTRHALCDFTGDAAAPSVVMLGATSKGCDSFRTPRI
jgi:UDP-N-acetyl-D-mannosaminuronate dehydrogenase